MFWISNASICNSDLKHLINVTITSVEILTGFVNGVIFHIWIQILIYNPNKLTSILSFISPNSPNFIAEVKNEWKYTSTTSVYLQGVPGTCIRFYESKLVTLTVKCLLSFCFMIGHKARVYSYFLTCVLDNRFLYMCCVLHVLQKYIMFVLVHFDRILDYKYMNNVFHINKYAIFFEGFVFKCAAISPIQPI